MATLKPVVRYLKDDNTAKVEIRIGHKTKMAYMDTGLYVTKNDLAVGSLELKKSFNNKSLNTKLNRLRDYLADIGYSIKSYDIHQLKDYLIKKEESHSGGFIDFVKFIEEENQKILNRKGKNGTYYANAAVTEWLKKFTNSESVNINDISVHFLEQFEDYMRDNNLGTAGISSYLRALRTLFINARKKYNDKARDIILIKHYPFEEFRIKEHIPTRKRNNDVEVIKHIVAAEPKLYREQLGRDMYLLTFCLAGIAPIDLYNLKEPKDGYTNFIRDKVKERTRKVMVRIKVGKEAQTIIDKYSSNGFLSDIKKYASAKEFSRSCKVGIQSLLKRISAENMQKVKSKEIPSFPEDVTLYWARHSFSTIAGMMGYDTNLIDYTLGHAPSEAKMAEVYIERKQQSVDALVDAVIKEIFDPKPQSKKKGKSEPGKGK